MNFNQHWNIKGKHAFLSPSSYHWIRYDIPKLRDTFNNFQAVQRGTDLHDLASRCIKLKVKMPRTKTTFNAYVNDAIAYNMIPEQPLYYSDNCFGTADAISFEKGLLRIHDLKTGETKAHMEQLEIYDALFCLEYHIDPRTIDIEDRIYQLDEITIANPPGNYIYELMEKIVLFDEEINRIKMEG